MQSTDSLSLFGRTLTIEQWAKDPICRVSAAVIVRRLSDGWSPVRAIVTPDASTPPRVRARRRRKGATQRKDNGKWQAQIKIGKQVVYLGQFATQEEALDRYDQEVESRGLNRATNS